MTKDYVWDIEVDGDTWTAICTEHGLCAEGDTLEELMVNIRKVANAAKTI